MSQTLWETLGLTAKEADIYELLLKRGEIETAPIIRELNLKRATAYKSLYALEKKGLVTKRDIGKITHFRPEPPTKLLAYAEEQVQKQARAKADLQSLIPSLTGAYLLAVEKPIVSTFEGIKGLQDIYEDTLREGKEIKAVLQTEEVEPTMYEWLNTYYVKKRAKLKIPAKVIVSSGKWADEYANRNENSKRETIMVPNTLFPFKHEVDIYGNKVAFINYKKGEALIGVVITHPQVADTMRAWFDLAWIGAVAQNHKRD
jgi:sugar-specific transcriptional regulator TrmB